MPSPEASPRGGLRRDLLDQASGFILRSSVVSPTTTVLVVVLLWGSVPHGGLIAWAAITLASASLHVAVALWYRRRGEAHPTSTSLRVYVIAMAWGGLAWGSLPLLVLPDDRPEIQALVALFVVTFMAANTIFSSSLRELFVAFQIPMTGVAGVAFLVEGSGFARLLAVVVVYALAFSVVLHTHANTATVSAVRLTRQLVAANEQLGHQAAHDALTDLANRLLFREHLETALARARREDRLVAVLFFDLDRFKLVNDSLGHAAGDELLVAVADRVRGCLREGDVLGRIGGDEFTVLLTGLAEPMDAVEAGERVRDALRTPFVVQHRELRATSSIGLAVNTSPADTPDDLLRHADAAMYRAKENGRDRLEVFDESLRTSLARRLDDHAELRRAFEEGRITSWFQPEVDLATGAIVGAEALARWIHPERGVMAAGAFVPLVEECGLLFQLSAVTAHNIVSAGLALRDLVEPGFRLRANVSASQLLQPELLSAFLARLDVVGLDPSMFAFEVTETAVITDLEVAGAWLATARRAGITVALDDFGTGYSSLALLAKLPLDGVKLDLSFVREMTTSSTARAVVLATVELATVLGLDVVAEGVENREQEDALRRAGVTRAQGFLYSPAVPAETLTDWLVTGAPWTAQRARLARR